MGWLLPMEPRGLANCFVDNTAQCQDLIVEVEVHQNRNLIPDVAEMTVGKHCHSTLSSQSIRAAP
jgi:hypothetical protein